MYGVMSYIHTPLCLYYCEFDILIWIWFHKTSFLYVLELVLVGLMHRIHINIAGWSQSDGHFHVAIAKKSDGCSWLTSGKSVTKWGFSVKAIQVVESLKAWRGVLWALSLLPCLIFLLVSQIQGKHRLRVDRRQNKVLKKVNVIHWLVLSL